MLEINTQYRVLIADSDKTFIEKLRKILQDAGYLVNCVTTGTQVIEQIKLIQPHLIILEIEIPDIDGIELCQIIRETPELSNPIVVFLTKQSEDFIQIAAFKSGCDDFILKTIKPRLLNYRLMAHLNRQIIKYVVIDKVESSKSTNNLQIDNERFVVIIDNNQIYLPKKQFLLLQYLASQPSKVFTRDSIFNFLWGHNSKVGVRTIDVYIRKIREQIGLKYIKTIKGVGYRFE